MSLPAVPGLLAAASCRRFWPRRDDAEVWVLVRRESLARFERLAAATPWGDRAKPLVGDLTAADLGLTDDAIAELGTVDHVVHCAAIYDITVAEDDAARRQRRGHPGGDRPGPSARRDAAPRVVDRGGRAPTAASTPRTTSTSRRICRRRITRRSSRPNCWSARSQGCATASTGPRWSSAIRAPAKWTRSTAPTTSSAILAKLARLPSFTPMVLPDTGRTNIVPVDYVVDALVELMHAADRDGQTFHLTAPNTIGLRGIYRGIAEAAGLPPLRGSLPRGAATPFLRATGRAKVLRNMAATQLGIPAEILDVVDLMPTFTADNTRRSVARHRDNGSGVRVVRAEAVAVLGRAPRSRPGAARRSGRAAGRQARRSSPARPAVSAARRRSRSPNAARRYSRWPATPKRSTTSSPKSAPPADRRTRSPATSPTPRRWSTRSRTSSAGSATSTIWSTTRAGRSAGRSRRPPTGCTTTNG